MIKELGLKDAVKRVIEVIKGFNLEWEKNYFPFERVLAELTYRLKDPYLAFKITTEKQPRTKEELKNFREFYKKEIEKYKGTN